MTIDEMRRVLERVHFPDYTLTIFEDSAGPPYLQGHYDEACVLSGLPARQATRKWRLSPHMTTSELVQTAFKLVVTSAEHRVREHFTYRGERVFGPHFDVEALVTLAREGREDVRAPQPEVAVG